jgi:hypothetical protein
MIGINSKGNNQNWINFFILKIISILSVAYFTAIPLGWVSNKFDIPDLILTCLIN